MEGCVLQVKMNGHIDEPVYKDISHLFGDQFLGLHVVGVWGQFFLTLA